jgi:hypothetical protein
MLTNDQPVVDQQIQRLHAEIAAGFKPLNGRVAGKKRSWLRQLLDII